MNNIAEIELFEKFLTERLSPSETQSFQARLLHDDAFAKAFGDYKVLIECETELRETLFQAPEGFLDRVMTELPLEKKKRGDSFLSAITSYFSGPFQLSQMRLGLATAVVLISFSVFLTRDVAELAPGAMSPIETPKSQDITLNHIQEHVARPSTRMNTTTNLHAHSPPEDSAKGTAGTRAYKQEKPHDSLGASSEITSQPEITTELRESAPQTSGAESSAGYLPDSEESLPNEAAVHAPSAIAGGQKRMLPAVESTILPHRERTVRNAPHQEWVCTAGYNTLVIPAGTTVREKPLPEAPVLAVLQSPTKMLVCHKDKSWSALGETFEGRCLWSHDKSCPTGWITREYSPPPRP